MAALQILGQLSDETLATLTLDNFVNSRPHNTLLALLASRTLTAFKSNLLKELLHPTTHGVDIAEVSNQRDVDQERFTIKSPLRTKISHDAHALDALAELYSWTPTSMNIRPSPTIADQKSMEMRSMIKFYASAKDYIFDTVFESPYSLNDDGKIVVEGHESVVGKRLLKNKFPYSLPEGTKHYVLWYAGIKSVPPDDEITKDIAQELKRAAQDTDDIEEAEPEFVWYENPKINPELPYHVQVFVKGIKPHDVGTGVGNAPCKSNSVCGIENLESTFMGYYDPAQELE